MSSLKNNVSRRKLLLKKKCVFRKENHYFKDSLLCKEIDISKGPSDKRDCFHGKMLVLEKHVLQTDLLVGRRLAMWNKMFDFKRMLSFKRTLLFCTVLSREWYFLKRNICFNLKVRLAIEKGISRYACEPMSSFKKCYSTESLLNKSI